MPPHSKSLWEEGAVFVSFKLVSQGTFREKELIEELNAPSKYPGSSGTRNLQDNLSDLRAQVAANQKVNNVVTYNLYNAIYLCVISMHRALV